MKYDKERYPMKHTQTEEGDFVTHSFENVFMSHKNKFYKKATVITRKEHDHMFIADKGLNAFQNIHTAIYIEADGEVLKERYDLVKR